MVCYFRSEQTEQSKTKGFMELRKGASKVATNPNIPVSVEPAT
jgi:hypothetical protein